ncbi:hypothetical protein ACLBW8_00845 [Pseudomonas sp. M5A4_2d]
MTNKSINKLPIIVQILSDPLKLCALLEKAFFTFLMISVVFFVMRKAEITTSPLIGGIIAGTAGALIVLAKKMYYDQALSKLTLASDIDQLEIESYLQLINYKKTEDGTHIPNKKLFSAFFRCKSESISITRRDNSIILTGPYDKIKIAFDTIGRQK